MGWATIDPRSHKVQTVLYKIPKFGVNKPNSKRQDTAIWKCAIWEFSKSLVPINHELYSRLYDFLYKFWHFQLLGLFTPNLGILWSTVCTLWLCGSIVAHPIIYRLVPSPLRFENRQLHCESQSFFCILNLLLSWKILHDWNNVHMLKFL